MNREPEQAYEQPEVRTKSKFVEVMAHIISFIFHPVFMPTILAYAMYHLVPAPFAGIADKDYAFKYLLPLFLITSIFPLVTVLLMKALDFVKSIHLYDPKDRIMPLIGSMVFYFWANHVFKNIDAPFLLRVLTMGSFWAVIALFVINIFYKVSMHTAGAGGMLGMLVVLLIVSPMNLALPLFLGLVVAGVIGTARMLLGAHRTSEIWLGYILGIVVQVAAYLYVA